MLTKLNHIKNIGRFYEVVPRGTSEASPSMECFDLIYADNGTGKTTLNSILKSLANNEPERILMRKTIPGDKNCEVSLSIDNRDYNFLNEKWNKIPSTNFAIFDEEFIEKNVFSSNSVDPNHKRQLFNYVILGEENVEKLREIQSLSDTKIPAINKEISTLESQLKLAANVSDIKILLETKQISLDEIKILQININAKEQQIKNSENIKTHKSPIKLDKIIWPDYSEILTKGIEHIGDTEKYKDYINSHHKWIREGLSIQNEKNSCPYCFQDLTKNEIIQTYKKFFSNECQDLINKLNQLSSVVAEQFSNDKIQLIEKILEANNDACKFWHPMDNTINYEISFSNKYKEKLKDYRETLLNLIHKKQKNILQPLDILEIEKQVLENSREFENSIQSYNSEIESINTKIEAIKTHHLNIDVIKQEFEKDKQKIKCQQISFHNSDSQISLARYRGLVLEKHQLTENLNKLRNEIGISSANLLEKYQNSINRLLKSFGVEFRISKVEQKVDTTRKDSLVFNIELKGTEFDPNGSKNVPYSLANTLSSGDRSTLAFAFFMAKLHDSDLSNSIVIFDDPISSLDFFRKQQTSKYIINLSSKAKQTIVLTHSMEFAKLFGHVPVKSKYFKIIKADSMAGVVFTPYNKLSDMCISKHYDEHETLTIYLSSPTSVERLDVLKSIRSYVETKLCTYIPELNTLSIPTLGNFISHLRKNQLVAQEYLNELEIINDSIVIENHGGDVQADDHSNLTDDELRNLCKCALELQAPIIRN